jgi:hypothetical protein
MNMPPVPPFNAGRDHAPVATILASSAVDVTRCDVPVRDCVFCENARDASIAALNTNTINRTLPIADAFDGRVLLDVT